jgi:hypothetical protein
VIYHLADLQSDFSAIHRIDDMYALDAPTFFRLAYRLPVYQGVLRQRLLLQHNQLQPAARTETTTGATQPDGITAGELDEDQVEELRNQARIRRNPKALRPGEQPQLVSVDRLLREST